MAVDVVPGLKSAVESTFNDLVARDPLIMRVNHRIRDGTAKAADAHLYAQRTGELLSSSYLRNMTEETLPNATMYYNIADRIVTPTMQTDYEMVNSVAEAVQKITDAQMGIGLNSVRADFPVRRIEDLIEKIVGEDNLEAVKKWLDEPIVNNSEAFYDDFVRENADTRAAMGLKVTIERELYPGCCEWCARIGGTYAYGDEPADVYRRHEHCRCVVTYKSERKLQSVWSKAFWQPTERELAERRAIRAPTGRG